MTPSPRHVTTVERVRRLLADRLDGNSLLRQESPVFLDDTSFPEPDLAIVRGTFEDFSDRHPSSDDIVAVIEVSLSSPDVDVSVKQPLHSAHGVRCVVIDVAGRRFVDDGASSETVNVGGVEITAEEACG